MNPYDMKPGTDVDDELVDTTLETTLDIIKTIFAELVLGSALPRGNYSTITNRVDVMVGQRTVCGRRV